MDEYISKQSAVDAGYLSDWYISSVGDEPPVWTDAHIDELLNDFIVIPKDTKAADVQPVDRWISCKDKMPEDNTLVLFVYVSKNGVKSVHYGYHQTLKGLGSSWAKPSGGWQYCDDDITHWHPLPEPPKDGDTNG